jgi:hypothetical protein
MDLEGRGHGCLDGVEELAEFHGPVPPVQLVPSIYNPGHWQVPRPRVRRTSGGEATLLSVARFRARDPLTPRMMQQLLTGVSTRQYEASLGGHLSLTVITLLPRSSDACSFPRHKSASCDHLREAQR